MVIDFDHVASSAFAASAQGKSEIIIAATEPSPPMILTEVSLKVR
jgi:hypothetical protein